MASVEDHYNKTGFLIFLISMVGSVVFFIYIAFIHPGVEGIDKIIEPSEKDEIQQAKKVEPVDPNSVDKPWITSEGLVAAGAEVYATNCASCHGDKGLGDGIAATPGTRNLVKGNWKAGGTSKALFTTLQNGLAGTQMASFKTQIDKNNRWALVHFVRSITKNKVADDVAKLEEFARSAD